MSETAEQKICKINYKLDLNDPLKSYVSLTNNTIISDLMADVTRAATDEMWNMVCESVQETVWKLLFDSKNPTQEQYDKAAALLKEHKNDVVFVNPTSYNTWIYKLRDELLKREMFDFWRNVIVAYELGIAWARDSDKFDNYEDPEPVNFYKFAGSEAAWLNGDKYKCPDPRLNLTKVGSDTKSADEPKTLRNVTIENAVKDNDDDDDYASAYNYYDDDSDSDDSDDSDDPYTLKLKVLAMDREFFWNAMFSGPPLDSKQAAEFLLGLKFNGLLYEPYVYNDWIVKVRDELFKRKYFDFWKILCRNKLGWCWYKETSEILEEDDTQMIKFYKSGDELMKQHGIKLIKWKE